jgi:hypothetical protein
MTDEDFSFFRAIAFHLFVTGYHYSEAFVCIRTLYGSLAPELPTVKKWFAAIESGEFALVRQRLGGKQIKKNLSLSICEMLKEYPKASTKFLASCLGGHPNTVKDRLINDLGMKQIKFQWIPHLLTSNQKLKRIEGAKIIETALKIHRESDYKYLVTGDESWFFYDNECDMMWLPSGSKVPTKERRMICSPKILLTVFFSGERIIYWSFLERGDLMNSERFIDTVLTPMLSKFEDPEKGFIFFSKIFIFFFVCRERYTHA